jgi:signal transduction histidine kinase
LANTTDEYSAHYLPASLKTTPATSDEVNVDKVIEIVSVERANSTQETPWRVLLRLRWLLGGVIALAFASGQLAESLLFGFGGGWSRIVFDVIAWGALGGLAVWLSLTWAGRQEQRYQVSLEHALRRQRDLNHQLQRANKHLALLSAVNRHIADSTTLDHVLDASLTFPQQLIPAYAAALLLNDESRPIVTRTTGAGADEIAQLRARFQIANPLEATRQPHQYLGATDPNSPVQVCVVLPLQADHSPIGRIELYLTRASEIADDELELLETIASEIAEAIVSARRRSQEERAIYELERAIADERARIARDIHDGIAQTLAFRRMRVDLWLDWITTEPERLREELIELKQTLREQIADLRRAIFALRPVQFDELGFVGGLDRYVVEFAGQHGWELQVDLSGVPPALSPDLEAASFRIVQEALTNVAKHAGATQVAVRIDQVDDGLRVTVCDNGRGFNPGAAPEGAYQHVGLRQMRERIAALRGHVTVLAQPGAGAEIRAWIPLQQVK